MIRIAVSSIFCEINPKGSPFIREFPAAQDFKVGGDYEIEIMDYQPKKKCNICCHVGIRIRCFVLLLLFLLVEHNFSRMCVRKLAQFLAKLIYFKPKKRRKKLASVQNHKNLRIKQFAESPIPPASGCDDADAGRPRLGWQCWWHTAECHKKRGPKRLTIQKLLGSYPWYGWTVKIWLKFLLTFSQKKTTGHGKLTCDIEKELVFIVFIDHVQV